MVSRRCGVLWPACVTWRGGGSAPVAGARLHVDRRRSYTHSSLCVAKVASMPPKTYRRSPTAHIVAPERADGPAVVEVRRAQRLLATEYAHRSSSGVNSAPDGSNVEPPKTKTRRDLGSAAPAAKARAGGSGPTGASRVHRLRST